jgi:flavin-dependent dehydrogenase
VERADVLIVGGGPGGSACARALVEAGRDVLVLDSAEFPRDKPCGGWITPEVLQEIPFSIASYAKRHVVQPIVRFRVGRIGGRTVDVDYGSPVSYGIRRREFDAELLRRSGARVHTPHRVKRIEREGSDWVVDRAFTAPVLVGAGGNFCPVARLLDEHQGDNAIVVGREAEFLLSDADAAACRIAEDRPELYFCGDLRGYGWCFRKHNYLNVGLGRLDRRHLSRHLEAFLAFLGTGRRIGPIDAGGWRGHAYRIREGHPRRVVDDGVILVGDAAGLAASASGEGILPALVSGRLAAGAIVSSRLSEYEVRLSESLGKPGTGRRLPDRIAEVVSAAMLTIPGFTRHMILDRWFLHRSALTT